MKIPKKLKIGGHIIKVDLSKELESENGNSDYAKNIITICKTLNQSAKESTLIHEAMHFMNATLNHELLDSLAEQMYQFLKDNNLLTNY